MKHINCKDESNLQRRNWLFWGKKAVHSQNKLGYNVTCENSGVLKIIISYQYAFSS